MSKNWTVILTLTLIFAGCSKKRTNSKAPENKQDSSGQTTTEETADSNKPVVPPTPDGGGQTNTTTVTTDANGNPLTANPDSKKYSYVLDEKKLKANYDAVKYCSDLVGAADKGMPIIVLHGKEFYAHEQSYPAGLASKLERNNLTGANHYLLIRDTNTPVKDKILIHLKRQIGKGYTQEFKNECGDYKYAHIVFEQENDTAKLKFKNASKLSVNQYECYILSVSQKKLNKEKIQFRLKEIGDQGDATVHNKIVYTNDSRDLMKIEQKKEDKPSRKERRAVRKAKRKAAKNDKKNQNETQSTKQSASAPEASRKPVKDDYATAQDALSDSGEEQDLGADMEDESEENSTQEGDS
ncbi:MAG: hypothetical protein QE271_02225 [Bacteriovoracaceae bacterium]|nr:hypothetical protein [Bacteriovoracaceae bacterium]